MEDQAALAAFARDVLEILERNREWDADVLDRIAGIAQDTYSLGYADSYGCFHRNDTLVEAAG